MPKANTYRVERLLGPYGFSITDCLVVDGNRRRPATFSRIGDSIDLTTVDLKSFIRSSMTGQIHRLLVGGALSTMPQEVTERLETAIQEELATYGISNYNDHPIAAPVKYVELEPGIMVAIAQVAEPPKTVDILAPPPLAQVAEIEPGITAPTAQAGGGQPETLAAPVVEAKPGAKKRGRGKKAEAAEATAETPQAGVPPSQYADWKFNLDFQAQKREVLESIDLDFLAWVSKNDDSVQFQKLAEAKLAAGLTSGEPR